MVGPLTIGAYEVVNLRAVMATGLLARSAYAVVGAAVTAGFSALG